MKVALFFASHHGKLVGVDDERLTIVLGHDVEDYSRYEQQDSRDNEHNCSDECGEARHHAGMPEVYCYATAQYDADDADNGSEPSKNGSGLYSRIMRKMVLITLMPSPTVSSLLTEPSGRSRY